MLTKLLVSHLLHHVPKKLSGGGLLAKHGGPATLKASPSRAHQLLLALVLLLLHLGLHPPLQILLAPVQQPTTSGIPTSPR